KFPASALASAKIGPAKGCETGNFPQYHPHINESKDNLNGRVHSAFPPRPGILFFRKRLKYGDLPAIILRLDLTGLTPPCFCVKIACHGCSIRSVAQPAPGGRASRSRPA